MVVAETLELELVEPGTELRLEELGTELRLDELRIELRLEELGTELLLAGGTILDELLLVGVELELLPIQLSE